MSEKVDRGDRRVTKAQGFAGDVERPPRGLDKKEAMWKGDERGGSTSTKKRRGGHWTVEGCRRARRRSPGYWLWMEGADVHNTNVIN